MPRGMSECKFCGKLIPSMYHKHHEETLCKVRRLGYRAYLVTHRSETDVDPETGAPRRRTGPLDKYLET
jgi:hypothetical protein